MSNDILRQILLFLPPFVLSLTIHEYAHAWAAKKLGDKTAQFMGRMTMDPLAHMDFFGTLVFPIISIVSGSHVFFGWANPVPVDMRNFKNPRKGMALVAAAGPASNLIIAAFCVLVLGLIQENTNSLIMSFGVDSNIAGMTRAASDMLKIAFILNLFLAFFNLIPLPPLDGSRIVQAFVSPQLADKMDGWGMYSQFILLGLIFLGAFKYLAIPVYVLQIVVSSVTGVNLSI